MKMTHILMALAIAIFLTHTLGDLQAAVVFSDGFGDADLDNNNVALEPYDVDVSQSGNGTAGDAYDAPGSDGEYFPAGTMIQEVTQVEDANDVGIKWFAMSGFSGSNQDPRANIKIVDDGAGKLPETVSNAVTPVTQAPINKGLALGVESKGRGNGFAGFFPSTVSLGQVAGDKVKVSFDFRVWLSSPNENSGEASAPHHDTTLNHIIENRAQVRWGIYQDTDSQLGTLSSGAGPNDSDAVWGEAPGDFDGADPGAKGDNGWYVYTPIDNPYGSDFDVGRPAADGADAAIWEEPNTGRILDSSDQELVAQPGANFVNLDMRKVYNLSLTLERFEDPDMLGSNTIKATYETLDYATATTYSFSDYRPLAAGGIQSDSWDYFAMSIGPNGTWTDDIDYLIDDWKLEVFAAGGPGDADFDDDGDIDGQDFLAWQRGEAPGGTTPENLQLWQSQYASLNSVAANSAVPEPSGLSLLVLAVTCLLGSVKHR